MDFFNEDEVRKELIERGEDSNFRKSYSTSNLARLNSSKFWNKKIITTSVSSHLDEMTQDRIKQALNFLRKGKGKVLDIGVGYGYLEERLVEHEKQIKIYGIDIADEGLAKIAKKITGVFEVGSILKIPFSSKQFECVFAMEVLEHIPANLSKKAYKEIKRVMKLDGQFIASVPINETYTVNNNPNQHMRRYSKELFLKELELNGFEVERFKEFYAFKNLYVLKNLLRRIFISRWKPNVILVSCSLRKK